jgi:glycosyltransferase involved in cell wall biosynthesis
MNYRITVITVVYNGVKTIEKTIQSVLDQTFQNIEYIIIDGGSKDGTAEIIKKSSERLFDWVSEPDKGLYYAMNKGIEKSTGDWIILMNCGDCFYDQNVVSSIFLSDILPDISAILGGAFVKSYWGDFYIKARNESDIWKSFVHQSLFTRRDLNIKYNFNTDFVTASDFDFVYTILSYGYKFMSTDRIVSTILYESAGFTSKNELLNKQETLKAIKLHAKNRWVFFHHYSYHLIAMVRKSIAIKVNKFSPKLLLYVRRLRDKRKLINEN